MSKINVQFFVFRFHFVLVCRIANGIVTLCLRNDWNNWLTGYIQCIMQELNWNECKCDARLKCTIGIDSFCVLISNYTRFVHRKCQTIKIKTIALEMPITAHAISDWSLAMAISFCFFSFFSILDCIQSVFACRIRARTNADFVSTKFIVSWRHCIHPSE